MRPGLQVLRRCHLYRYHLILIPRVAEHDIYLCGHVEQMVASEMAGGLTTGEAQTLLLQVAEYRLDILALARMAVLR